MGSVNSVTCNSRRRHACIRDLLQWQGTRNPYHALLIILNLKLALYCCSGALNGISTGEARLMSMRSNRISVDPTRVDLEATG